jgi:hypothetical protein
MSPGRIENRTCHREAPSRGQWLAFLQGFRASRLVDPFAVASRQCFDAHRRPSAGQAGLTARVYASKTRMDAERHPQKTGQVARRLLHSGAKKFQEFVDALSFNFSADIDVWNCFLVSGFPPGDDQRLPRGITESSFSAPTSNLAQSCEILRAEISPPISSW